MMWAANAARMGCKWKIGDGRKVKFWEDYCIGKSSLAIQYWDLYIIVNEKNRTVHDLWDENNLKFTFTRIIVIDYLYRKREEITQVASTIIFSTN